MSDLKIIVDGSNGAFYKRNSEKKAKLKNIKIILEFLENLKNKICIEYEIITDANLKYLIDNFSLAFCYYLVLR